MAGPYATTKVKAPPLGNAALLLGGADCGVIYRATGGDISAQIIRDTDARGFVRKHLGAALYEPFELQFGFSVGKPLFDWIAETWRGDGARRSGAVLSCDDQLTIHGEHSFKDALILETTIPALDQTSLEPAWLGVQFASQQGELKPHSGKASGNPQDPEKLLTGAGFKLEIDGLDCGKVRQIQPLTFRQQIYRPAPREPGEIHLEAGTLDFSDVSVIFRDPHPPKDFSDWHERTVVRGGPHEEKSGTLTLLSHGKKTLAKIKLHGLGLYRLGHASGQQGDQHAHLAAATMYCDSMEFEPG